MSIEWGLSTVCDLLKGVVILIKRPVKYAMSSKRFADDLREEVRKLENEAQRVHDLAQMARYNLRNFHRVFTEWEASAEKALKEAGDMLDDFDKASKTCCYGTLPDPYCRYQFSTKAEAKIEAIQGLARDCIRFGKLDDICLIDPASRNVAAPTPAMAPTFSVSMSNKLREAGVFESRALMIRNIMDALANDGTSGVGVYGMGGVGKSTLLGEVKKILSEEKLFDWVTKADVSENPDIKTIQGEIAIGLGLTDIENKNIISDRAELLRRRLEEEARNKKKVLIILDNLWEGLDLNKVGIPCGHDNKVMGCKLLLTSRDRDVLRRKMGCDKDFLLGGLNEDEAKRLFDKIVGNKVHDDEFKPLVNVALGKCAGVPFLIVAMAKRFEDAELYEWRDTLKKFEKFKGKEINDLINHMLQWSYDKLQEDAKSLLQLCVVYGVSTPSLEYLLRYGFGLGLFQEVSSMEEARDRLHSQIRTLQASSLLLDSEDVGGFKIHDLVREFVALVASRNHPILVLKDKDMSITELPKDKFRSCGAICFPYVDMKELPQELDCPELHIFLLFNNNESLEVPDSYFNSMKKLMVLDLTGIRLTCSTSPPPQFLENLHTLCLDNCSLDNVAFLGKLKGLQILSFMNSNIHRLPEEIGQLTQLRLLDLNHCRQLKIIEPGVLQHLIKLEELYMQNSFDQWNTVDQTPPTNANLIELNHMKHLHTLHVSIPCSSMLPEDLNVEKLTKYGIQIGDVHRWSSYEGSSTLELNLDSMSNIFHKGCIQSILGKTDDLFLDRLNNTEQSICALSQKGFPKLKHLQVKNSPSVHYILQSPSYTDFKTLEWLLLESLVNLEKICNNKISSRSFSALKVVRVKSCPKMEVLFPLSVARELSQLEEIKVDDCQLMRGIVEADDCGKVELHNLRVLELCNLPNIKNFFNCGSAPLISTSNNQVTTQIAFFNGQQVAFSRLETLVIHGLDNVEFLFFPSMIKSLVQLRDLRVSNCQKMEAIITEEEGLALEISETLAFPMLTNLGLYYLESLTCFSRKKCLREAHGQDWIKSCSTALFSQEVAFSRLETLVIDGLNNVEFLFFPSTTKSLAQLRDLTVQKCQKMEAIIMEEEGLGLETSETLTFPMLTRLKLQRLQSLMCFSCRKCSREARSKDNVKSHSSVLFSQEISIPCLESLTMEGLPNMKEIWSDEYPLELSNLRSLQVECCESLSKFISSKSPVQLHKLHSLHIRNCNSVQEIFDLDGPSANGDVKTLSELNILQLSNLGSLRCIWNKNPCGIVSFHNLKELEVDDCPNLKFMFFPSMVKSLAQLRDLTVQKCQKMEAIIMEEEGLGLETSETLTFPMLTRLKLQRLESLMCFSCRKCSREARSKDNVKSRSAVLFSRELSIPSLVYLTMEELPHLKEIWSDESPLKLSNLQSLQVVRCESLSKVIRSRSLVKLHKLHTLTIKECVSVQEIFYLDEPSNSGNVETLSELTAVKLNKMRSLRQIWNKSPCGMVNFHNLKNLEADDCDNLRFMFFPSMVKSLAQLRNLTVRNCKKMEAIITEEEGLGMEISKTLAFPMLSSLYLGRLESLTCFSCGKCSREVGSHNGIQSCSTVLFNREVAFPRLETLEIRDCDNLGFIFFPSMVKSFTRLKKLHVWSCEKMEAIIMEEEGLAMETSEILPFPMLTDLKLSGLSSLTCFSRGKYSREARSHDHVNSHSTALFNGEVAFQRLETLEIVGLDNLEFIFFPSMVKSLTQLKNLTVSNCKKTEAIITEEEGLGMKTSEILAFKHLKFMKLDRLIKLRCFSSGGYTLMFPLLEDVIVTKCPNMKFFYEGPIEASKLKRVEVSKRVSFWNGNLNVTIQNMFEETGTIVGAKFMQLSEFPELIGKWHSELNPIESSWQLESLVVDKCPSFVNAIPSKLMLVLENLHTLQVRDCESLEEIFDVDGLEAVESPRVLSSFTTLDLVNLPKLRRLWNKDLQGTLCFSSLTNLILYKCSDLRHAFALSMLQCLANIFRMEIKECHQMEGVIVEEEGQGSAMEKFTFPHLYTMELECLPKLTSFFLGKNHTLECPYLKELTIAHCPMMRSLTRQSLMEIDQGTLSLFTPQVQFPQLRRMVLSHMDSLSKIWTDGPQETLTFDNLREVEVQNCKSLENLLPHWVATSLTKLKKLRVESCGVEEIVMSGDDTPHSNTAQVLFPNLIALVLHDMPQLKSFCPNLPTLTWPFLEKLRVTHCDKLNMLSFVASMNSRAQTDDQQNLSGQEAHSSLERDFPSLKRLSLVDKNIQMIQDGNFPEDIFGKLIALTLACFQDEKAVFPPRFLLERFQNLQKLKVFCSSFEDIFPDEGLVDEEKPSVLENLKELKLNKLHNLKRVWREDSLVSKILQNIQIFEVWDCPCLTTIFPTVTSFQNLTNLVVKNSSGLTHLVTVSAVTNLVHLTYMIIIGCERMKEIVANDGNEEGQVISFGNLNSLTLQHLPSLECFSSIPNCIFKFPSLWKIEVEECPKMKTFSKGMLSTPMLHRATLFRYDWGAKWGEGDDLNTIIQKLSA